MGDLEPDSELRKRVLDRIAMPQGVPTPQEEVMESGLALDMLANLVGLVRKNSTTEERNMATLSERVDLSNYVHVAATPTLNTKAIKENNMTTLRTINLTLVDNNPNLKVASKVVFQKLGYMTEHSNEQAQQQILMSGDVAAALKLHNDLRVKIADKEIQRNTGRDVMLEEVEIFDLVWQVVQVA